MSEYDRLRAEAEKNGGPGGFLCRTTHCKRTGEHWHLGSRVLTPGAPAPPMPSGRGMEPGYFVGPERVSRDVFVGMRGPTPEEIERWLKLKVRPAPWWCSEKLWARVVARFILIERYTGYPIGGPK